MVGMKKLDRLRWIEIIVYFYPGAKVVLRNPLFPSNYGWVWDCKSGLVRIGPVIWER
jgi:hypothetical protein